MVDALATILTLVMLAVIIALILKGAVIFAKATSAFLSEIGRAIARSFTIRTESIRSLWFLTAGRGKLLVRASTYLMAITQEGATIDSANNLAARIDSFAAGQLKQGALYHVREAFNGSSLALISEARLKGFNG